MTQQDYFNQALTFLGQPVETEDPTALDQCMDWAFKWCDILGVDRATIRRQYAYQVWREPNDLEVSLFEFIPNTPNGVPHQGDIIIFDQNVSGITGVAGHICVATGEGDSNSFKSLDQNWNGVKHITQETHAYTGVLGWLRPRMFESGIITQAEVDQLRADRDNNWNLYQQAAADATSKQQTVDNLNQQINDRNNDITQLNAQIKTAQTQIDSLEGQINTLQPIAATVPGLNTQLAQAKNDRQLCLDAQGAQNVKIANLQAQIDTGKPKGLWNKLIYVFS